MPMKHIVEEPAELLAFLFSAWPEEKRKQVRTWLKFQCVTVNGRAVSQFNHPLRRGDEVAIRDDGFAAPRTTLAMGIKVLFEDASLIVIDKPEGLLSIASEAEPERTAYFQLTEYLRAGNPRARERVWIVHRLDRETSGLMVFAKTPRVKETLQATWDAVEKHYEAVVEGRLPKAAGVLKSDLDERNPYKVFSAPRSEFTRHAVTHYRVLAEAAGRSLVELRLETGRRHQIRVQLKDAGCPIVGDEKYGSRTDPAKRLGLHAVKLEFPHPVTGEKLKFVSALPKELARLVKSDAPKARR